MKKSPYSAFDSIAPGPRAEQGTTIYNRTKWSGFILDHLRRANTLMTTKQLSGLGCPKKIVTPILRSMRFAGLAYYLDAHVQGKMPTRFWAAAHVECPAPLEAARLAALGLFYFRWAQAYPGLEWMVLPGQLGKTVSKKGTARLIDPVRPGQEPNPAAQLFVFADQESVVAPGGGGKVYFYTTDRLLLDNAFRDAIRKP